MPLNFISYEAPLLRKHDGDGGNICKMDLLGFRPGSFWPIEYKQRYKDATSSRYGVLESLAYGVILAQHIHDNPTAIVHQVGHCINHRGPYLGEAIINNVAPNTVRFSVAAPPEFYDEDTGTDRRMARTQQFTEAAQEYAAHMSQVLGIDIGFGGFMIIGARNANFDIRDVGEGMVVRTFHPQILNVPVYATIAEVHVALEHWE